METDNPPAYSTAASGQPSLPSYQDAERGLYQTLDSVAKNLYPTMFKSSSDFKVTCFFSFGKCVIHKMM